MLRTLNPNLRPWIIIIMLLLLFIGLTRISLAQSNDSITVSRNELIHFAENALKLKTCNDNYKLQTIDLTTCKSAVAKSIELNKINDTLYRNCVNQRIDTELKLNKSKKEIKRWKTTSLIGVSGFATCILFLFVK